MSLSKFYLSYQEKAFHNHCEKTHVLNINANTNAYNFIENNSIYFDSVFHLRKTLFESKDRVLCHNHSENKVKTQPITKRDPMETTINRENCDQSPKKEV